MLKLDAQMLDLAKELKTEQSLLVFGRGYNYATALEAALKVRVALLVLSVSGPDSRRLSSVSSALWIVRCMCPDIAQHCVPSQQHTSLLYFTLAKSLPGVRGCQRCLSTHMILLLSQECECWAQVKEVALMHSEGLLAGEMKHGPLALVDEHLPLIVVATRDRMYAKMLSVVHQLLARGARLIILCNAGDAEIRETCASRNCRLIEVRLPGWHLIRLALACHLLCGRIWGHLSLEGLPCAVRHMCRRRCTALSPVLQVWRMQRRSAHS